MLLTAVLLLMPDLARQITGVSESPVLGAPDDLPPLSSDDTSGFFQSRNHIVISASGATTLREFLDRNRLNKPFHRKQVVEQLGSASPDAAIAEGAVFRIRLTPVAEDVPGVAPQEGTD